MLSKKTAAAALLAAGVIVGGGTGVAEAATSSTAPPTTVPNASTCHQLKARGTRVTGAELAKVTAAVRAEEGNVTVRRVIKDGRGEYHVIATKSGQRYRYLVSADLKSITLQKQWHRAPWQHRGAPVTGAEYSKVAAAVRAKEGAVTIQHIFQGPRGNFHVLATRSGKRVAYYVSANLKTVTVQPANWHRGPRPWAPAPQTPPQAS